MEEEGLEMDELLGMVGHYHYNRPGPDNSKTKAKIFKKLEDQEDPYEFDSLPINEAIFVKQYCNLGRRKYSLMRRLFSPYINLPSHEAVAAEENKITPLCKILESFFDKKDVENLKRLMFLLLRRHDSWHGVFSKSLRPSYQKTTLLHIRLRHYLLNSDELGSIWAENGHFTSIPRLSILLELS